MAGQGISLEDLIKRYHLSQNLLDRELSEEHLRKVSRVIDEPEIVGPELGLTKPDMSAISSDMKGQELQRLEMLRKWKQKFAWKATYRELIEALLRCNRGDNARDVCELLTDSATSKQLVASAGYSVTSSCIQHDVTGTNETERENGSKESKNVNSSPISPPSCSSSTNLIPNEFLSEDEVKEKVQKFWERFNEMAYDTLDALKKNKVTPKEAIYFLKMPDPYFATRDEHIEFWNTLTVAADITDLFDTLNGYWDHFNYHLLERLLMAPRIEKCIGPVYSQLQEAMKRYVQEMDKFRRKATLGVYCKIFVQQRKEVPKSFRELITTHEWSMMNTLHDVEEFRQRVAQKYQFRKCLVFFKNVLFGSVKIIWWIPIMASPLLMSSQLHSGYTAEHCMNMEVTLKSKLLKLLQMASQCSASLKEKNRRHFQNYDAKFISYQESWKTAEKGKPSYLPEEASVQPQVSTPTSKEPLHLPQLTYGTSREYHSFQYNRALLRDIIGPQIPILWLAQEMLAKGLITHQVLEEVTHSSGSLLKDKQLLVAALDSQISTNAANFHKFLRILSKKALLEDYCKRLRSFPDIEVITSPTTEKYTVRLKDFYLRGAFKRKWPHIDMKKFIKLITIEKKQQKATSMHEIFQPPESNHTVSRVLVEGGPGSGKSTFALELCTRWAKGEMLQQFVLVFLLPLRDKHVKKAKSLTDLLSTYFPEKEEQDALVKAMHCNNGEGVLLILEGFDELPIVEEEDDTWDFFVSQLFANRVLPNSTVLVTTRPHASVELHDYCDCNAQILQIVGFGEEEVKRYIEAAGLSAEKRSSLTAYLKRNPHIREMVYNPLNCAILVQLYQRDDRKSVYPITSTHLFNQLVKDLLLRYMKDKYGKCPAINWEDFPQCLPCHEYATYLKLCEMAYDGFLKGNSEFNQPEEDLNLMEASNKPLEANVTFHFLHPSLQEYLTAFWIRTYYSPEEQLKLMKKHIKDITVQRSLHTSQSKGAAGRYENVLRFLAGLSNKIVWEDLAKHAFVDRQTLNVSSFYLSSDIQGVHLPFLSWLFENQNADTCAEVLHEGTIGFYSTYNTTPSDYYALAYCIANSVCKWEIQVQLPTVDWLDTFSKGFKAAKDGNGAIVALDVGHSQISKEGWEFLFSDSINPLQPLQQLIFYDTKPPCKGLQNFADHLPKLKHLQCLVLSNTKINEGGAVSLIEALPQTEITELHLYYTGIGFLDCQALAQYLSHPQCKLKSLDISYNGLKEKSVNVLTNALIRNVSLTKLSMSDSTFSPEGITALVKRLKTTPGRTPLTVLHLQKCVLPQGSVVQVCTIIAEDEKCALQSLALGLNPLELSDIEALATMLQANHSIVFLYLKNCSISAEGFSVFSTSLYKNSTLCELSLSGNELSQVSINAVCKGFFSETRFACENIPSISAPPLLCLDSCPDEWKDAIIETASEYLQMYDFFQIAQAKHLNHEPSPDVDKFMELASSQEQKQKVCNQYIHFSDHTPACGKDTDLLEEMRPSFVLT